MGDRYQSAVFAVFDCICYEVGRSPVRRRFALLAANDINSTRVLASEADSSKEYFCPICTQLLINRLNGKKRIPYFAHYGAGTHNGRISSKCTETWSSDMSEWHKEWQNRFPSETIEIIMEYSGEKHRADVKTPEQVVVEFQHSNLSLEEFRARNRFYHDCDCRVIWVFDMIGIYNRKIQLSNKYERSWTAPKKLFRQIKLPEDCVIIFQTQLPNEKNSPVLEMIESAEGEFRQFKIHDKKYTIDEFVECITHEPEKLFKQAELSVKGIDDCFMSQNNQNSSQVIDVPALSGNWNNFLEGVSIQKTRKTFVPGGRSIKELYNPYYRRMIVRDLGNDPPQVCVFPIYQGRLVETPRGKLRGQYSNANMFGKYIYSEMYTIPHTEDPCWELIKGTIELSEHIHLFPEEEYYDQSYKKIEDCVLHLWIKCPSIYAYILQCAATGNSYIIQMDTAPYGCSAYQIEHNGMATFTLGEDALTFALENKDKPIWKCIGVFSFD